MVYAKCLSLIRMFLTLGILLCVGITCVPVTAVTESKTATVTLTVPQYVLVLQMKVTPDTVNVKSTNGGDTANKVVPPLHIILYVPDCVSNLIVYTETLTLNGVLMPPQSSPPGYDPATDIPPKNVHYMHFFFDRQEVINKLHLPDGDQVITLQAEITGGHMVTASDTFKVIH